MIYNALNNGNDEMACSILAEHTADIAYEKDIFSLNLVIDLLHNILNLLKSENPAILINEGIPHYIRGREEDLLKNQFPECFRRIGRLIKQNREKNVSQFGERILDYINKNISNPNLFSGMVQDHFNISMPTLQKLVKQLTGHTYQSYVETLRLTKAKELLTDGGFTIKEVSTLCGFSNRNSFFKAFKRVFGFPPSSIK